MSDAHTSPASPSGHVGQTHGEFSVAQFFANGTHEYVRRYVGPEEAVKAAQHYMRCVGAQIGTTVRVVVTDGDDFTNLEWKRGEGITYPPRDQLPDVDASWFGGGKP